MGTYGKYWKMLENLRKYMGKYGNICPKSWLITDDHGNSG
jgi:hypothetical protein